MEPIGEVLKRIPIPTATSGANTSTSTAELDCSVCGGAGYLTFDVPVEDPKFGQLVACECTKRQQSVRHMKQLEGRSNLGPLRHKTFENFIIDPRVGRRKNTPEGALAAAKNFAQRKDRPEAERLRAPEREWLVMSGNHGTGKTHLAAAIANIRLDQGRAAVFIVVPDLLDRLRSAYSPTSDVSYDDLFESARSTDLLLLDDLGAQSSTPWAQEKLYQIINERYNRRLPTVITTNLALEGLELRIRSRIGDEHLADHYVIVGHDVRLGVNHVPEKAPTQSARGNQGSRT